MFEYSVCSSSSVFQNKLIGAVKKIKHEVDLCDEEERETYVEAADLQVKSFSCNDLSQITQNSACMLHG